MHCRRLIDWARLGRQLLLGLCAFGLAGTALAQAARTYTLGVVPQFEQRKLFATWLPIVEALSQRTGIPLTLEATLTVADFEKALADGRFDLVYANPYHILREAKRQGYVPLVRDREPLRGILVVPRDSPLRSPAELDGERLAVPSMNALGASLLLRADLAQRYKAQVQPVNVKTHSSVYFQVANGLIPAGGGVEKTLQEQPPEVRDLLRVLYVTRDMPSHPLAAHPRLPANVRDRLQKAMLELARTPEGQVLLAKVPMPAPVATRLADFTVMQAWGLDQYWVD